MDERLDFWASRPGCGRCLVAAATIFVTPSGHAHPGAPGCRCMALAGPIYLFLRAAVPRPAAQGCQVPGQCFHRAISSAGATFFPFFFWYTFLH